MSIRHKFNFGITSKSGTLKLDSKLYFKNHLSKDYANRLNIMDFAIERRHLLGIQAFDINI